MKCQPLSEAVLAAAAPSLGVAAAGSASEGVDASVAARFAADFVELDVVLSTTSALRAAEVICAPDGHAFASNSSPKNIADTANFRFDLKRNSLFFLWPGSVLPTYQTANSVACAERR